MAVEGQFDKERTGDAEDDVLNAGQTELDNKPAQEAPDDAEAAFERVKQQLEAEKQHRIAAERKAAEAEGSAHRYRQEAQLGQQNVHQANLTAVSRALEGTQTLMSSLKEQYRSAMEQGDWGKVADLQEKISDASARKLQLEQGKAHLEAQASRPPQQEAPQHADAFEAALSRYTPRTQAWLRNHPDVLRDPKMTNLALAAHHTAVANGHVTDSDSYFDAMEHSLGYKTSAQSGEGKSRRQMAAPPSRSGTASGRQGAPADTRDMTPKMLQLAKESDMKPEDWLAAYKDALASGEINPIN